MKIVLVYFTIILIFLETVYSQDATIIYKNNVESIVTIETDIGLGSGFFVGENIIATNFHVIEGATVAHCYSNSSDTKYEIEGYLAVDKSADLILLKVSGLNKPSIKFSTTSVTPGQKIFVLGSPLGLPATISDGIVSGMRDFEGYKLIQITAPISHGSSGGPVLDAAGELIGISVGAYEDGQNLNFAIPKSNLELLLSFKKSYATSIASLSNSNKTSTTTSSQNEYVNKNVSFSCYYREYCDWNSKKEIFVDCEGYEEYSIFEMNAEETMFNHTTETIKSAYHVSKKEYDAVNDVWTYDVTNDVGNPYIYVFDKKNNEIRVLVVKEDKIIMIRFYVKAIF